MIMKWHELLQSLMEPVTKKRNCADSVFSRVDGESLLDFLARSRPMGGAATADDGASVSNPDEEGPNTQQRYSDPEWALVRRIQYEGNISSSKMPIVLVGNILKST